MKSVASALLGLLLCFNPFSASAHEEGSAETAMARVVLAALAPTSYGDWAYRWDAVSIRVSKLMHWHVYEPDPRDRAPDAIVRRNGWVDGEGRNIGVSIYGGDARVTELSFEHHEQNDEPLLAALRAEGASIVAEQISNERTHYRIAKPGQDDGELIAHRQCTSPQSRAARRCWTDYTLTLPTR